jgi:hypothetical protein
VLGAGPQSFSREIPGGDVLLGTVTEQPLALSFYPSEEPATRCQLVWQKVELPVRKGATVGELLLYADNEVIQRSKLLAANDVDATFTHAIAQKMSPTVIVALVGLMGLLLMLGLRRRT